MQKQARVKKYTLFEALDRLACVDRLIGGVMNQARAFNLQLRAFEFFVFAHKRIGVGL